MVPLNAVQTARLLALLSTDAAAQDAIMGPGWAPFLEAAAASDECLLGSDAARALLNCRSAIAAARATPPLLTTPAEGGCVVWSLEGLDMSSLEFEVVNLAVLSVVAATALWPDWTNHVLLPHNMSRGHVSGCGQGRGTAAAGAAGGRVSPVCAEGRGASVLPPGPTPRRAGRPGC